MLFLLSSYLSSLFLPTHLTTPDNSTSPLSSPNLFASSTDPFAATRDTINPFSTTTDAKTSPAQLVGNRDERKLSSDEWGMSTVKNYLEQWLINPSLPDASKTPPSRFQQRKGSIYSTPSSRDSHIARNVERDAAFHAKLIEKGWAGFASKRRGSSIPKETL